MILFQSCARQTVDAAFFMFGHLFYVCRFFHDCLSVICERSSAVP